MERIRPFLLILFLVAASSNDEFPARTKLPEYPVSWAVDLTTLGYPIHASGAFLKTIGSPPKTLEFADAEHLVATFIFPGPNPRSEREGIPNSFDLHLNVIIFDSKTGRVETKRDWPSGNPNDGIVSARNGQLIVRVGDRLVLYSRTLDALKAVNMAPNHASNGLYDIFVSPTGRFVLIGLVTTGLPTKDVAILVRTTRR